MKVVTIISCIMLFTHSGVWAETGKDHDRTYKLVFTQFDDSSAGNFKYLRNSVQTMLAARLSGNENVMIMDQSLSQAELAKLRKGGGEKSGEDDSGPDYLVDGAIFALKGGLNTQVVLYPFKKQDTLQRFSILTQDTGTLIPDIENLANDIASTAFGRQRQKDIAAAPSQAEGTAAFVTAHPEAAFKRKMYSGTIIAGDNINMDVKTVGGKKTTEVDNEMITMTVADLDGDGSDEILILFPGKLDVYQVIQRKIEKIAEFTLPKDLDCHALNVADLDGNSVDEIYISATRNLGISSLILNWSQNSLTLATDRIPFYIRPVDIPGMGLVLAGQEKGLERINFLKPGLFTLERGVDNRFKRGAALALPESVNLFDFIFADLDGDGKKEIAAVDKKERLKVYNSNNELLWVSKKTFGGSKIYLGPSMGSALNDNKTVGKLTADEEAARELNFIPGKLLAVDINKDGRDEIVISEQDGMSIPFFQRLRFYTSGYMVGLSWANEQLNEIWRTGNFSGYLAGYGLSRVTAGDKQGPTRMRLYVGQVPDNGSLMSLLPGAAKSNVTVFEMEFSPRK